MDLETGTSLASPLLTRKASEKMVKDWPSEAASKAKLLVPENWKSASNSAEFCNLRYNSQDDLLLIVAEDNTILDIIDPYDLIGADLELHANLSSSAEPRASSATSQLANAPVTDELRDTQGNAVLTLYCYSRPTIANSIFSRVICKQSSITVPNPHYKRPMDVSALGNRVACHRVFQVAPAEDLQPIIQLVQGLVPRRQHPQTYLIIVNPRPGPKRNGQQLAETVVRPMLKQAHIDSDINVTQYPRQAVELAGKNKLPDNKDITDYDGLVLIGGDGIIHEVLNGIAARENDNLLSTTKMPPIGVIGCGTANGFATSLTHASHEKYGVIDETFLICKGITSACDVSRYSTSTGKEYISFLTYTWAIIADIDIESERIHFMGESRFDVWAVWRILFLRKYRGRFSYLPPPDANARITMPDAVDDVVPSNWITIEDSFLLFWASQVTHAGMSTNHTPAVKINEGIFQIMIVRGHVSRYRLARILLALETGTHVHLPGVEFVKCVAYRLEPLSPGSFNDIDGEPVEDGPIQAQVLSSAMRVFCNPSAVQTALVS